MSDTATTVGVGDAVVLRAEGYPVPVGSKGAVRLACDTGLWLVDFGPGAQHLVREGHMAVTAKAPDALAEEMAREFAEYEERNPEFARHRAAFLRDLTDGPATRSGPCASSFCGGFDEPDDSVTDDLRDLISSQSLAMATARTRQGVGIAAMAILMAAKGDELGAAISRGLKAALGGLGDLLDGVDLDALVRQAMGTPAPKGAEAIETVTVGVQIDGKTVGTILVPVAADEAHVVAAIRSEATIMAKIPADRHVASVEYLPGKVVRITTAPVEAPPAAE